MHIIKVTNGLECECCENQSTIEVLNEKKDKTLLCFCEECFSSLFKHTVTHFKEVDKNIKKGTIEQNRFLKDYFIQQKRILNEMKQLIQVFQPNHANDFNHDNLYALKRLFIEVKESTANIAYLLEDECDDPFFLQQMRKIRQLAYSTELLVASLIEEKFAPNIDQLKMIYTVESTLKDLILNLENYKVIDFKKVLNQSE